MHLMRMPYIKEGKIRRGWHGEADRYGKRKREKEHESVPRGARGEEKVNGDQLLDR